MFPPYFLHKKCFDEPFWLAEAFLFCTFAKNFENHIKLNFWMLKFYERFYIALSTIIILLSIYVNFDFYLYDYDGGTFMNKINFFKEFKERYYDLHRYAGDFSGLSFFQYSNWHLLTIIYYKLFKKNPDYNKNTLKFILYYGIFAILLAFVTFFTAYD